MELDIDKIKQEKSVEELLEFGIINIDKPVGPTSFSVSDSVKKKLGLRKTSHFGTLDPKVTGILPVALNRACKLTGFFIGENKKYIGIMRLHKEIDLEKIKEKIKEEFLGDIMQTPPVKSRVKREERKRNIKSFEIIEKKELDVLFEVDCQGGTYIRKLIHDLGESLGIGAHMLELRRTKAGIFAEKPSEKRSIPGCIKLYEIDKAFKDYQKGKPETLKKIITPAEIVSELYNIVQIKEDRKDKILTGKPIYNEDVIQENNLPIGDTASVFCGNQFIGMYKLLKKGDLFAKPEFVLQPVKK